MQVVKYIQENYLAGTWVTVRFQDITREAAFQTTLPLSSIVTSEIKGHEYPDSSSGLYYSIWLEIKDVMSLFLVYQYRFGHRFPLLSL